MQLSLAHVRILEMSPSRGTVHARPNGRPSRCSEIYNNVAHGWFCPWRDISAFNMGTRARGPTVCSDFEAIPNDTEGRILINGPSFTRVPAFSDETTTLRHPHPLLLHLSNVFHSSRFSLSSFFSPSLSLSLSLSRVSHNGSRLCYDGCNVKYETLDRRQSTGEIARFRSRLLSRKPAFPTLPFLPRAKLGHGGISRRCLRINEFDRDSPRRENNENNKK